MRPWALTQICIPPLLGALGFGALAQQVAQHEFGPVADAEVVQPWVRRLRASDRGAAEAQLLGLRADQRHRFVQPLLEGGNGMSVATFTTLG